MNRLGSKLHLIDVPGLSVGSKRTVTLIMRLKNYLAYQILANGWHRAYCRRSGSVISSYASRCSPTKPEPARKSLKRLSMGDIISFQLSYV